MYARRRQRSTRRRSSARRAALWYCRAKPFAAPPMPHRYSPPPRRGRTPSKPGGAATAQVQSLTRGLSILEALARAEGGLTLTDVSQRVDLPPSTTHRLLATLDRMGYVYQAGELGRWYIGLQA